MELSGNFILDVVNNFSRELNGNFCAQFILEVVNNLYREFMLRQVGAPIPCLWIVKSVFSF
jgi:hypothetical protein